MEGKKWVVYFDGTSNKIGAGIGVLLVSPDGSHTPLAMKLNFNATNTMVEYQACIMALEAAIEIGAKELEVYGDSALLVSQRNRDWQVQDEKLRPYHDCLNGLREQFKRCDFIYLPRDKNQFTDALATLVGMVEILKDVGGPPTFDKTETESCLLLFYLD